MQGTKTIQGDDYTALLKACKCLSDFNDYRMYEYIPILLNTVLDFQMKSPAVSKARDHFQSNHRSTIRSHADLGRILAQYPNTRKSNSLLAQYLWGNNHWSRAMLLRALVKYFESQNVRGFKSLSRWIKNVTYQDIKGQIRVVDRVNGRVMHSIGPVLFEWLRLRLGEDTVKSDVWVKRFMKDTLGYLPPNEVIIGTLVKVAGDIGVEPRELDAAIWHHMSGY